jgi:phosphoglycolate phosphatase-like HAD superfamily hydrolase
VRHHPHVLEALLFDVDGTLTDTSPLGGVWGRPELGDRILQQAVSTAIVETLLDRPARAFPDHLQAALEVVVADAKLDDSLIDRAGVRSSPARTSL